MKIVLLTLALASPALSQMATEHQAASCAARPLVLGCANAVNLAAMIADPADLDSPRAVAPAIGAAALLPIERYRTGKTLALPDIGTASGGGAAPE